MTHLKRIAALLVLVVVGIATRLVVTYGIEGAIDAVLQRDPSAHVAVATTTHKPAVKPGAAARAAMAKGAVKAPAGAAPATSPAAPASSEKSNVAAVAGTAAPAPSTGAALMPSGPLGAGPKAAARNAAAATNAQIAEETGQSVPDIAGRAGSSAPAPVQQGAPAAPAPTSGAAVVSTPVPARLAMSDSSSITREMFEYKRDSRRDPFISLMTTNDLRPTLSDLQLTGILYDLSGRRPVAILRDVVGGQWRVTTGMTLGRMRVQQIKPKTIIFTIEEFGFNRQDSLVLGDTTHARSR